MHAAELINAIQQRLHSTVEFSEVTIGHYPTAEFKWKSNTFLALGIKDRVNVLHKVENGVHYQTMHSSYLQGIFDGGVRDDFGNLIQGPAV